MIHNFIPGDFLVFQLESGYGLLRVLAVDEVPGDTVWHVAAYSDLFPDVDLAEAALTRDIPLPKSHTHLALTDRAFESTQVAKVGNSPLTGPEMKELEEWRNAPGAEVHDRSVRLLLGLR
jgi:hypothetical protein